MAANNHLQKNVFPVSRFNLFQLDVQYIIEDMGTGTCNVRDTQTYTPRTLEESCKYSALRPSPTNIFLPAAIMTAWAPSSYEGDGDGSDM